MTVLPFLIAAWVFILVVVCKDSDTERRGYQRRQHWSPPYKNQVE